MKRITVILAAAIALTASAAAAYTATGGRPYAVVYQDEGAKVTKVCDEGRAVYVGFGRINGYAAGTVASSIAVVENASECRFQ